MVNAIGKNEVPALLRVLYTASQYPKQFSSDDVGVMAKACVAVVPGFDDRSNILDAIPKAQRGQVIVFVRQSIRYPNSEIRERINHMLDFFKQLEENKQIQNSTSCHDLFTLLCDVAKDKGDPFNQKKNLLENIPGLTVRDLEFLAVANRVTKLVTVGKVLFEKLSTDFTPQDKNATFDFFKLIDDSLLAVDKNLDQIDRSGFQTLVLKVFGLI